MTTLHSAAPGSVERHRTVAIAPTDVDEVAMLSAIPDYPVAALPEPMRRLVETAPLPAALLGGAALAAVAAAIGSGAVIQHSESWEERCILWVPLIAPRGSGKSPSQAIAFNALRRHDAKVWPGYRGLLAEWRQSPKRGRPPRPVDPRVLSDDATIEALARRLDGRNALAADVDELAIVLRGMGQYKRGGGSDRGRVLALWTGGPWVYERVGDGDGISIFVPHPTLVICGGLQPPLHHLLGSEDDGLRPRWLPHLSRMPDDIPEPYAVDDLAWAGLLAGLVAAGQESRAWNLGGPAKEAFNAARKRWKKQARDGGENASTSAALEKADVHLLRVVLAVAEAERAAHGGAVSVDVVDRASAVVEFTLRCWRALPEQGGMALSLRDERLDHHVDRLVDWLEQHGGRANRRQLLRATAGGARTSAELDALLAHYEARHPGTVSKEAPSRGGVTTTTVRAPLRQLPDVLNVSADIERGQKIAGQEAPFGVVVDAGEGLLGAVGPADTDAADIGAADIVQDVDRWLMSQFDGTLELEEAEIVAAADSAGIDLGDLMAAAGKLGCHYLAGNWQLSAVSPGS